MLQCKYNQFRQKTEEAGSNSSRLWPSYSGFVRYLLLFLTLLVAELLLLVAADFTLAAFGCLVGFVEEVF